jgi:acylphosphatase
MLHVEVRGRVQGVGFRWFVRERARALGLKGWVRNNVDGTVEVLAVGTDGVLEQLRELLREGPPGAHVSALEERHEAAALEAMDPFGIAR